MQRRLLYLQLVVVAIVAFFDIYFGLDRMYFWTLWWYDIPMHILGGIWAGLFGAWALLFVDVRPSLRVFLVGALVVGAGWEVFEYVFHMGGNPHMSYPIDTLKDLIDDALGGLIGYFIAKLVRL